MVVFICNHCGESEKKPSVEKHYNTKCRGAKKSVSCMDCQKDFQDDYVAHTKCISEMEKYSGKDFVPRENQNKGEKKQEGWVETVRGVLDSSEYNLDAKTRTAFEKLQNYNNVPQKKAKFLNFVTSSVHIPWQTVENVWSILEKEQLKLKEARQAKSAAAKKEKQLEDKKENKTKSAENNGEPQKKKVNAENMEEAEEDNEPQKKKIKVEEQNRHSEQGGNKKQKKNQKTVSADSRSDDANKNGESEVPSGVDSKKEKKQKKKQKQKQETNGFKDDIHQDTKKFKQNEVENFPTENGKVAKEKKNHSNDVQLANGEAQEGLIKEKPAQKKKKNSKTHTDDINENKTQPQENCEEVNVQKNKKKNKDAENSINANITSETENYIFRWDDAFDNVLNKYNEGIALEKFKKKILKKYKTKFEDELTENQLLGFEKKFNKKLKKNTFLKVEEDIVKPVN